jgi:hypothetical protein
MNFVYLRSYMLKLSAFFLDSCIVNKGEKFVHALGTWECLKGVPIGSSKFWVVWCRSGLMGRSKPPRAVRCVVGGLTAWGRRSNRPGSGEQFLLFVAFLWHCCIVSWGVCFGSGGSCICAGGALCGVWALVRWFALFVWAWFCLGCVEPLPLPKGSETCLLQVTLLFAFLWLSNACWGLFSFVCFFFFLVLLHVCVVNALIKGEIEDHVWFEDRWMVASLCDEWLTTLCGLILG